MKVTRACQAVSGDAQELRDGSVSGVAETRLRLSHETGRRRAGPRSGFAALPEPLSVLRSAVRPSPSLPIGQVFDAEGDHGAIQEIARRARPLIEPMKIASFNINNINRRLPNLLSWLREAGPDIVSLQELKAADTEFPGGRNPAGGLPNGLAGARSAGTAWRSSRDGRRWCASAHIHRRRREKTA
jgi:hypothetical protein